MLAAVAVGRTADRAAADGTGRPTVSVSIVEIYNERLTDLLAPGDAWRHISNQLDIIKECPNHGIIVPDAIERRVGSIAAFAAAVEHATRFRAVASTMMGQASSRRHTITLVHVDRLVSPSSTSASSSPLGGGGGGAAVGGGAAAGGGSATGTPTLRRTTLRIVDMAGSERVPRTGATGASLREESNINRSLSSFRDVMQDHKNGAHIRYRDSKLTRLLQASMQAGAPMLVVACVSPSECDADETQATLHAAQRFAGTVLRRQHYPRSVSALPASAAAAEDHQEKAPRCCYARCPLAVGTGSSWCAAVKATKDGGDADIEAPGV
jgi:hypothetical protein